MADIPILGKFKAATTDGILADAAEIADGGSTVSERLKGLDYANARLGVALTDAVSLSAAFDQGYEWVYAGDGLDTLRPYLTVTATLADDTTIPVEDYALSGALTEGVSTIRALYGTLSAPFTVKVTGALPEGYTRFDYIMPLRQSNPTEARRILTKTYTDLYDYSLNLLFGHTLGTPLGEASDKTGGFVLGGRGSSEWTKEAFNINVFADGVKMTTHGRESNMLSVALPPNTKHRLIYSNTASSPSSFAVDGGAATSISWNSATGPANTALAVCSRQRSGEAATLNAGMQCGEFELTALDGSVAGHYIPCVRTQDFVIGLWETVDREFHTATDTSYAQVDSANCLYFVGNWAEVKGASGIDYTHYTKELVAAYYTGNTQAMDTFADRVFTFRANGAGRISVMDLLTKTPLADYACAIDAHGNTASFRKVNGIEKAAETDEFPLYLVHGPGNGQPESGSDIADWGDYWTEIWELRVTESGWECNKRYRMLKKDIGFGSGLVIDEQTKIGYSFGSTKYISYDPRSVTQINKWDMYNGPSNPDHSYAKEREHGMIKKNRKGAQYHGTQTVHSAV